MEKLLNLAELADLATRVVEQAALSPKSNQAKARPAPRMLRYYQQQGLLSEPVRSGRTHLFGRRHLLEVLAVKRLQSEGKSLDEIRTRLAGVTLGDLEVLAALPAGVVPSDLSSGEVEAEQSSEVESAPAPRRRSQAFWASRPSAPVPAAPVVAAAVPSPAPQVAVLSGLELAPGVDLLLRSPATLTPEALVALRGAAQPLLEQLAALGLTLPATVPSTSSEESR